MNKRTKIMLVLLSAATMTAGVMGITGCKNKTDKTKAVDVYQSYVAYAEANGQEPMTYEQWLETVKGNVFIKGDPGQPGAPGAPGEAGKPGETGAPGKGVEDVVISDDGKSLEINYTDGTKDTVKLPDQVTHVHQYDDTVITLIPVSAEEDRDGLGYKVCTENGCEHIELVVINKYYNITVKDNFGEPVEGVDVVINGARSTTNEKGLAKVQGFGNYNDYIITVDAPGYTTDQVYRTLNGATQELTLNRALTQHGGDYDAYYTFDALGVYSVGVTALDDWNGGFEPENLEVRLYGGETEAKKYRISVVNDDNKLNAEIKDDNGSLLTDGAYEVVVADGEFVKVYLSLSGLALVGASDGQVFNYSLKVEELELPAQGTAELPVKVALDETVNLLTEVADGDGWVYYKWVNNMDQVPGISFNLTNAEASFIKAYYNSNGVQQIGASPIVSGETFDIRVDDGWGTMDSVGNSMSPASFVFRVKATGANPSFKLNISATAGNIYNPQQVTLGTKASLPIVNWQPNWFKFTVDTETVYTVILGEVTTLYFYDSFDNAISMEMVDPVETLEAYSAVKNLIKLAPGEYYLKMEGGEENHEFTLRLPIAEDEGSSIILPKDISSQVDFTSSTTATITAVANNYYTFVAPEDGKLNVSGGARLNSTLENQKTYQAGDKIIIQAVADGDITLTWTAASSNVPVALPHTFTIKDNSNSAFASCTPVQGVTVTVKDGDAVVATSQATDANGQVTVSFIPGSYKIELSGYNAETYSYEGASTNATSTDYDIRLASEKYDYTFTAKTEDGTTFSGATVKILRGATVIASGTTNGEGVVTFQNVFIPTSGKFTYTCELASADAEDYAIDSDITGTMEVNPDNKATTERDIVFAALVEYSVKVVNVSGSGVQGIGVTFSGTKNGGSAVTGLDGVAKIKVIAGEYSISYSNVPSGHNVSANTKQTNATTFEYEAQYLDGDRSAIGLATPTAARNDASNPDNKMGALGNGINVLTNNDSVNYYTLTGVRGRYTLRIDDAAGKGYISYLSIPNGSSDSVLILNGKQNLVAGNIVLGDIRGRDKAYEVTLDLSLSQGAYLVIGYHTGTENGGKANLVISQVSFSGEYDLHTGENNIAFVNGSATLYYTCPDDNFIALSWNTPGVTVSLSIGGDPAEPYTSGYVNYAYVQMEYVFTITSTSATNAVFNLTVEDYDFSE